MWVNMCVGWNWHQSACNQEKRASNDQSGINIIRLFTLKLAMILIFHYILVCVSLYSYISIYVLFVIEIEKKWNDTT